MMMMMKMMMIKNNKLIVGFGSGHFLRWIF